MSLTTYLTRPRTNKLVVTVFHLRLIQILLLYERISLASSPSHSGAMSYCFSSSFRSRRKAAESLSRRHSWKSPWKIGSCHVAHLKALTDDVRWQLEAPNWLEAWLPVLWWNHGPLLIYKLLRRTIYRCFTGRQDIEVGIFGLVKSLRI